MVLLQSENLGLGEKAVDFDLLGISGERYSLESFSGAKVLVIAFICNHCPYVQAIWGRLNELQSRFGAEGVQLVGINPNTANEDYEEETMEKMKEYAKEYEMNFPYLEDGDQSVAKAYGAVCTPDIYVYDQERKLAYHGRIDDNWKDVSAVTQKEMAEAISTLLKGERPQGVQSPSMGCSIKWTT